MDTNWGPTGGAYTAKTTVGLGFTTCPSDPRPNRQTAPVLAYAVNSGLPETDIDSGTSLPVNGVAAGVFHNLHRFPDRTVSLDYLSTRDGSTNTVMLAENVHATEWANPEDTSLTPWQAETSIVWWRNNANAACNPPVAPTSFVPATPFDAKITINAGRDDTGAIPAGDVAPANATPASNTANGWTSLSTTNATNYLAYAAPSSRHPGGAIITFCDGHTQFVPETLDYEVYKGIMTPYGARYGLGVLDAGSLGTY
jgi:prepilin-type processing-associated H-X9-DG protein